MIEQRDLIADLTAECEELDGLVAGLDEEGLARPTPAPGWTIAHQIAHVSFVFRMAAAAVANPTAFKAIAAGASSDFEGAVNAALADYLPNPPSVLLERWRGERNAAINALAGVPGDTIVPWLVRPLPAQVLSCAGLMELFAHGQDIADALGVRRERTDRIGPVAWFTTLTWDFGYPSRGETPPDVAFRFELTAPSGARWTFGPEDATQGVTGSAEDLCLLATRRRHRDDLDLVATGADAEHWLDVAQAYRGPAGAGRTPGQFAVAHHS